MTLPPNYYKPSTAGDSALTLLREGGLEETPTLEELYFFSASALMKDKRFTESQKTGGMVEHVIDLFWEKMGRPTWYVDPDLLWFLENVNFKPDLKHLRLPRDIVTICFPWGYMVEGRPLRWIKVAMPKSPLFWKVIDDAHYDVRFEQIERGDLELLTLLDDGEQPDGSNDWSKSSTIHTFSYSGNNNIDKLLSSDPLKTKSIKMALALIMYVQAHNKAAQNHRRSKKTGKKVKFRDNERFVTPLKTLPKSAADYQAQADVIRRGSHTKRFMKPHLRGWVLRHLWSSRYKRNEDGSVKTTLVEPCLIGAKTIKELPRAGADVAIVKKDS